MLSLDPSDVFLLIDFVLAIILLIVFTLTHGFGWVRDRLGWVIAFYALAVVALLFLISWATLTGERLIEIFRLPIAAALGVALVWKTVAIITERRHEKKKELA